jgi:hypothetical protein
MHQEQDENIRAVIPYVVQGLADHQELHAPAAATALELLQLIRDRHPDVAIAELIVEDEEDVLDHGTRIVERVQIDFVLVHASRGGHIDVSVRYDNQHRNRAFRPSATIGRIIDWAISDQGFNLIEPASKFVLKLGDRVLEPELHLGQISDGSCEVVFQLVHTRKIQG